MQCLEQQQMQPDATNPALSATLPQPGAEQMREAAPVASHAAKISHGNDGPALQLMPRAAMPLPSNEPESPKSDYGGEYCMRLPVDDKAELSSAIIEDTLAALPVPPHAVSHVQGPILEVHQVDDHSVDIKIVHSFRASYVQPIDEVRQTAALAWQQRALESEPEADRGGSASDTSSGSSARQQWHQRGRGVHLHRPLSRHHHRSHSNSHTHHHHHYHYNGHHRAHSVEQCVECTELVDEEECMLPPDIKRCAECVVHEHEHDASTDTEPQQPSSNASSFGVLTQPNSRSSATTAEPAAAERYGDADGAHVAEGAAPAAAAAVAAAAAAAGGVGAGAGAGASPFAAASPFGASPFQAAGAGQEPFSQPRAHAAAAAVAVAGFPAVDADHATPQRRPPRHGHQQGREQELPPVLSHGEAGRQHDKGRLSVEVLRGGDSRADSGNTDTVVSPTAISDASDDVQAQLQQWQRQQGAHDRQRLGWRFEQQQLLQQLLQQQSSAVLYPEADSPRHGQQQEQQQQQGVHVRLMHKHTAHGHEQVRVSPTHQLQHADVTPPDSPQHHQHQQQQELQMPQSQQQLQLVRQEQQWMHSPRHKQQQQDAPWEQKINQLDMNVLRPPAGFTPLSGDKLPHYVLAQEDLQQQQHQLSPREQQQQPTGTIVPARAPQADRFAPHPGLVAHLQGKSPAVRRHPALGFQPRCEWELDPRKVLVGRRLAVGGFAEVFLGKYEGTVVAVKRLLTDDASTIERFVSEVRLLARLRHPNLILFMGYCITPELCIVSEYMSKGSLYGVLHSPEQRKQRAAAAGLTLSAEGSVGDSGELVGCGPSPKKQQLQGQPSLAEGQLPLADEIRHQQQSLDPKLQRVVAISVARGMAYLHSRCPPILHLDLKSPNILLDDRWRVKITDFGLSRARQKTFLSSTAQGGTPEWMAPEVLRCEDVAEPADVYSYGVVLWELITGRPPWENYNPMQVVAMVGFRDMSLPLPASAADPFLLDMCRRCLHRVPEQRPMFEHIVSELDQHYGPPAWSAHAQPLLPPTMRLPLPAAAALRAASAEQQPEAGDAASADSSQKQQHAVAAATAALAVEAAVEAEGPSWGAAAEAKSGTGAADNRPAAAAPAGAEQRQQQPQDTLPAGAASAATAPPKLFSPFGGAELPPWSVESVDSLAEAQPAAAAGADAAQVQQPQHQHQVAEEGISSTSTAPPKLFSPFGGGAELPPWSVESVQNVSGSQHAPAEAAAAITGAPQQQQQQQQEVAAGADGQGANAAPGKLFSPFGGGAELPPWSVDSVASLSGTPAHMQDASAGQAADAVRGPSSRPRVLRQASSSDTSSSSGSSAADRQQRAAGGLGGQLGSSMAASTQPGSESSAAVLHMQKCMAPAGPHPAGADVALAGSPKVTANGMRQQQQQQVQQVQQQLPDTAAPVSTLAAAARSSSPEVRQAAVGSNDDADIRVSACNRGVEDKLDSRESSPFEEVQFPAGAHVYLTPLKVGSGYHEQPVAAPGATDHAPAAAVGSDPVEVPEAAAVGAAVVPPSAPVGAVIPDPFAQVADQPLGSSSSGSSGGGPHTVMPPAAVGSAPAAAQQRSRQLNFSTAPCVTGHIAGGSWTGQLPARLQAPAQGMTATAPAAAVRNGPVSTPSATGAHAQAAQHGEAWHLPLDAAATGSWTHQSMTGLGSSNWPSDGSFMRSLWPSMTGTDPSLHSLGLPVVLDSPRQHDSSSSSHGSKPASAQHSPAGHGVGASGSGVAPAAAVHQQDLQLPMLGQQQQQQVYQVWPVLYASEQPHINGLQQDPAHSPQQHGNQQQPPAEQAQHQQGQQQVLQPKTSGQHGPTARSTSFQRKGRFMVSTMTPEPPAGWDGAEHWDTSEHFSDTAVAAAGAAVGAAAAAHAQAVAGNVGTSLPLVAPAPGSLHGPGAHWGPFGTVMQPGWPLLGSSVSAPSPNVDLMSGAQQQRVLMMQHEQGLVMQLSAPAKLGVGASQPGTPSTTPTATTPVPGAAGMPSAVLGTLQGPFLAAVGPVGSADALPGRMSEPGCRNLAGKGYWGSGIMNEPSGADSSGSRSMRCSHEGIDRCTAAVSLSPQALLHAAGSSGDMVAHEQQQQQLLGGRTSSNLWASMLQQVSNCNTGGLCYRSGRFHVTVEQLQAWQQRQQELQQQHAHLPHKSNSTGALLAAAGLAAAESSVAEADVLSEGTVLVPAPQQPQPQQQPLLQRQPSRSLHVSSSCSSLSAAKLPQQQEVQAQASVPAALQSKQQQRGKAPSAVGASATQLPAAVPGKADHVAHAEESSTDTKRLCDLQPGGSTASSIGSPSRSVALRQASSGSSTSCLKLKTVAAAKASPTGSLANPMPPGAGKPPVVPCKTPSPAATPCLSPKLQRAKSRDYCKGRFQVHESPVVSHIRPDQKAFAPEAEAGSGPSHTICVAELQHLQKQALAQLPELQQIEGPPQLQPAPTLANISSALAPAASAPPGTAADSKQAAQSSVVSPVGGAGQSSDVTLMPRSAGNSPLTLKVRTRASGSSVCSLVGSSGQLSDGGGSVTPTALAAAMGAEGQVSSDDGGKAAAVAAAAVVQQRGRFTVRQESRPSSRPSSAHGSKAGSPRGSTHHHAGLSKLGSKSAVELTAAATAAAAAAAAQPAVSDENDRTSGSGDVVQQTPAMSAVQQQQQPGPQHQPMRSSTAGSDAGSSCSSRQGTEAGPAPGSVPVVADHPQLPPIRTVSKKGRFVVTQLTPASTACCTPKSAGAATTPTAEAAAAGALGAELAPAVTGAAAELLSKGELSVSSLGPLVTCPVCAVAQVMPQLPHQLSGQLLGLVTEPGNLPQQAGTPKGASEAAAAAACVAIAAAVSETQLAAGLSTGLVGAGSSPAGAGSAAEDGAEGAASTACVAGSSALNQAPLHTCSSCGAPLPPMSQQDYKSAAAAAAAGVLDAAAAAAASLHPVGDAAGAVHGAGGSASSSLQSSGHEASGAPLAQQMAPGAEQHAHGASPRTPQGLLAIAAAKVLAARQQQQLAHMQRHQHQQQQQHRVSHDAASSGPSSSRTPGQHSGRRSFEPPWHMHNFVSTAGGQDLFSESSYQHSGFSSGRSSNSSIAALAFPQRERHGMPAHAGPVGEVVFGGSAASGVGAAGTSAHQAAGSAVGDGSVSEGSSRCRTPVPGCSPEAAATPHASAADSPMRWAVQQRAAAVLPAMGPSAALPEAAADQAAEGPAGSAAAVCAEPWAACVAPAPAAADNWPKSHAAEWMDLLSSGQASSSGGPGSSRDCTSPDSAPAH